MKIKAIMIPKHKMYMITLNESVREAIHMIDEHNMLSLPVIDNDKFIGALSKQHIYETFFKSDGITREDFLNKKVSEFMHTKLVFAKENTTIEKAAEMFIASKFRFIPVLNENDEFTGIVTQQAVFKEYQKLFGSGYHTLTICFYDYQGTLARLATMIAKEGGNIKNSVVINTDTMGLHELFLRIECDDFEKIVTALVKEGYDVRR